MNPLNHVAIIMDGNGRWGIKNKNSRKAGYKAGIKTLEKIIKETIKNKINFLTLYTFSTENWKRPIKEINYLFKILENFLKTNLNNIHNQDIKLNFIGEKLASSKLNQILRYSQKKTSNNTKLQINLAFNYGSRQEIIGAIKKTIKNKKKISYKNFINHLKTKDIPDPDLLIRTGNRNRLSNFLLWQLAYSEIFFEKKLWPDFNENDFRKIIFNYKKIKRNFGGI